MAPTIDNHVTTTTKGGTCLLATEVADPVGVMRVHDPIHQRIDFVEAPVQLGQVRLVLLDAEKVRHTRGKDEDCTKGVSDGKLAPIINQQLDNVHNITTFTASSYLGEVVLANGVHLALVGVGTGRLNAFPNPLRRGIVECVTKGSRRRRR